LSSSSTGGAIVFLLGVTMDPLFKDRLNKVLENLKSTKVTERRKARDQLLDFVTKRSQQLTRYRM